ncbi:DNRLRE domain-containing protein [Phycisphaeraceae bacterium D3-23]
MSGPGIPYPELLRLCIALSDGTISAADFRRLDSLIQSEDEARAFYLEFTRLSAALEQRAGASAGDVLEDLDDSGELDDGWADALAALDAGAAQAAPVDRTQELARRELDAKEKSRRARRAAERAYRLAHGDAARPLVIPKPIAWLGLAAALGLVATLVFYFNRPAPPTHTADRPLSHSDPAAGDDTPVLATVVHTFGAHWEGDVLGASVGDDLTRGAHRLVAGRVEIELDDGVRVAVEAPATFRLTRSGTLWLEHGRLVADVPSTARGFTIQTPTGRVVDRAATFGLAIGTGGTEVNVFRGVVDLYAADVNLAAAVGRVGPLEAGVVDVRGRFEWAEFDPASFDAFADEGLAPRVTRHTVTIRQGSDGYRGTVDTWFSGRTGLDEQAGSPRGAYLRVGAWDDVNQQAVLRFDGLFGGSDAQVPGDARVVLAELVLHNAPDIRDSFGALSPQGDAFAVHRLHVAWGEADGYGDAPWAGGATPQIDPDDREAQASPLADCGGLATAATSYIVPAGSWIEMDVTPAVAAWAAGEPNHGFLLQSLGGHPQSPTGQAEGDAIFLASAEYASDPALRPALVITYLTTDSP